MSLENFLKEQNYSLYQQYQLEKLQNKRDMEQPLAVKSEPPKTQKFFYDIMKDYQTISDLSPTHEARKYVEGRKIPHEAYSRIYYTDDFKELALKFDSNYDKIPDGEKRILFPLRLATGETYGVSARAIDSNELRYINIKKKDYDDKYYGIERYNPNKKGFVVEGAIDSEFLPNCLATLSAISFKKKNCVFNPDNTIIVYDNEPKNPEIVKFMNSSLVNGFTICIWEDSYPYKDINEAILNGMKPEQIVEHIEKNSYFGIAGTLKMAMWKKC